MFLIKAVNHEEKLSQCVFANVALEFCHLLCDDEKWKNFNPIIQLFCELLVGRTNELFPEHQKKGEQAIKWKPKYLVFLNTKNK
jgi:hypothetical protein